MYIKSAKDLDVYKLAYEQAMNIFSLSKKFPKEAWSKRRYIAHFTSKLIPTCRDDGENGETETWVDFVPKAFGTSILK